jgi:membrane associated rhomboid family serine protease
MRQEERLILKSFFPGLFFVALLWLVKGAEIKFHLLLDAYGIFPRDVSSLTGILTMPFIHGSLEHLFSNSVPLVILMASLVFFYREIYVKVFFLIWFLDGLWVWLGARAAWHIGASGLVYGLASFLLFSGILRRDTRLMAISMLVIFLYGGMVWGMFPWFLGVSYEAHIYGAFAGVLLAWVYRNEGPQRKVYDWELEPESEELTMEELYSDEEPVGTDTVEENSLVPPAAPADIVPTIVYHFKPEDEKKEE